MENACTWTGSAGEFLPRRMTLPVLSKAVQSCHGCALYCHATQAVFGAGPAEARVMLIGEQPGDQEDQQGKPFVGPAGRVLDEALEAVGLSRKAVYVTNAVKHFKFNQRGKRRMHSKPGWTEVVACKPWLIAELLTVQPEGVVLLGATAAQSLLGRQFRVTQHRGELLEPDAYELPPEVQSVKWLAATVHPSSLLRIPDREARHAARKAFAEDLAVVVRRLKTMH